MTKTEVLKNIAKEKDVFGMSGDVNVVSDNFVTRAITVTEWTNVMFWILVGIGSTSIFFVYCGLKNFVGTKEIRQRKFLGIQSYLV